MLWGSGGWEVPCQGEVPCRGAPCRRVPCQGVPGRVPCWGVPYQGVPCQGGTLLGGYPARGGTQLGQQKEYSLHGGRYASCVHAGGLSCFVLYFFLNFLLGMSFISSYVLSVTCSESPAALTNESNVFSPSFLASSNKLPGAASTCVKFNNLRQIWKNRHADVERKGSEKVKYEV